MDYCNGLPGCTGFQYNSGASSLVSGCYFLIPDDLVPVNGVAGCEVKTDRVSFIKWFDRTTPQPTAQPTPTPPTASPTDSPTKPHDYCVQLPENTPACNNSVALDEISFCQPPRHTGLNSSSSGIDVVVKRDGVLSASGAIASRRVELRNPWPWVVNVTSVGDVDMWSFRCTASHFPAVCARGTAVVEAWLKNESVPLQDLLKDVDAVWGIIHADELHELGKRLFPELSGSVANATLEFLTKQDWGSNCTLTKTAYTVSEATRESQSLTGAATVVWSSTPSDRSWTNLTERDVEVHRVPNGAVENYVGKCDWGNNDTLKPTLTYPLKWDDGYVDTWLPYADSVALSKAGYPMMWIGRPWAIKAAFNRTVEQQACVAEAKDVGVRLKPAATFLGVSSDVSVNGEVSVSGDSLAHTDSPSTEANLTWTLTITDDLEGSVGGLSSTGGSVARGVKVRWSDSAYAAGTMDLSGVGDALAVRVACAKVGAYVLLTPTQEGGDEYDVVLLSGTLDALVSGYGAYGLCPGHASVTNKRSGRSSSAVAYGLVVVACVVMLVALMRAGRSRRPAVRTKPRRSSIHRSSEKATKD